MREMETENNKMNKYTLYCCVVASMVSIIFGYDTGVMSGAMILIKEELKIRDTQVEILAGILNICALFGSLLSGRTSDYIGRRYTISLAAFIFFLGSVLMGYSPNYVILMIGRCVAGLGVGFALMIAPVYSSEISSASSRGLLGSLPELCISLGVLSGYISNYFLAKLPLRFSWRVMLGLAAIPSFVLMFGVLKMPESPRWLVSQGQLGKAKQALLKVSNTKEEAEYRLYEIKLAAGIDESCNEDVIAMTKQSKGEGVWKDLLLHPTPAVRRILLAAIGIHFFEHATGIEAVILYSPRIFRKAGVVGKDRLLLATIGVGLTKTTFILFSTFLLDRVGRRKLLLISVGGMVFALSGIGLGLTMAEKSSEKIYWALNLCIIATYVFVAFFSIGLAPITWLYSSEIFPTRLRAQGMGIGVAVNRLMNAIISMTFISLYRAMTIGGVFFMFAGIAVFAWFFFFFFCPETKGRTLEEMEMIFSKTISGSNRNGGVDIELRNKSLLSG